jgi:hypothetical protein
MEEQSILQLFSSIYGQDRQLLSDAYEAARKELQDHRRMSGNEPGTFVGPLVDALVSAYSAGHYNQTILTQYAVSRVLDAPLRVRSEIKRQTDPGRLSLQ